MSLILQLKEEHANLLHLFEEVRDGISDKNTTGQELIENLRDLKEVLAAHLILEDKLLYPKLATAENEEARKLGKKFSEEMLNISPIVFAFFGKYILVDVSKLKNNSEFEKELSGIIEAVGKRIEIEESQLFTAYEKYCK